MIKLINALGCELWVADNRVAEYIAAGCKPAVEVPPAPPLPKQPVAKKATSKKGTTKK